MGIAGWSYGSGFRHREGGQRERKMETESKGKGEGEKEETGGKTNSWTWVRELTQRC